MHDNPCKHKAFRHLPLNLKTASLRLIRVQPELSKEGELGCEIYHASTGSEYTCLSYVWGPPEEGRWIIVKGHRCWVRLNLWNFMNTARAFSELQSRNFWVDALCIDQENIAERNHQVQQMGNIFSHAVEVIAWLGLDRAVAAFMEDAKGSKGILKSTPVRINAFYGHPYWERAWISQEVALARRLTLMARKTQLPFDQLPASESNQSHQGPLLLNVRNMQQFVNSRAKGHEKGYSIYHLLELFYYKKCQFPEDRLFSLLALCAKGNEIPVQYGVPGEIFCHDVFHACRRTTCLCSARLLDKLFVPPSHRRLPQNIILCNRDCELQLDFQLVWKGTSVVSSSQTSGSTVLDIGEGGGIWKSFKDEHSLHYVLNLSEECELALGDLDLWVDTSINKFRVFYRMGIGSVLCEELDHHLRPERVLHLYGASDEICTLFLDYYTLVTLARKITFLSTGSAQCCYRATNRSLDVDVVTE